MNKMAPAAIIHGSKSARSAYSGRKIMVRISRPANCETIMPTAPMAAPASKSLPNSALNSPALRWKYDRAKRVKAAWPSDTTAMLPTDIVKLITEKMPRSRWVRPCLMKKFGRLELRVVRSTTMPSGNPCRNNPSCSFESKQGTRTLFVNRPDAAARFWVR